MPRKKQGRPPTGVKPGELVSSYHQLTIRIPESTERLLAAMSGALQRPRWRLVIDALNAYAGDGKPLSDDERRMIRALAKAHAKTGR